MSRTLAAAGLALLLAACGGSDEPNRTPTPTAAAVKLDGNRCTPATDPGRRDMQFDAPGAPLDPAKTYVATVDTNCGTFEFTLDAKRAPKTAGSFKFLADKGFYDGLLIHRIVPDFVLQGGDPKGDGSGGPGYSVVERPPKDLVYKKGVVAMAKAGTDKPGSSGSQFFVVTGDDAEQLPPEYALLGEVSGGQAVVDKIGAIVTDPRTDFPEDPVVIKTIKVAERAS